MGTLVAIASFCGIGARYESVASACGVPPPGSPPGFRCTGESGDAEGPAQNFRTSASFIYSSTRLSFSNDQKADAERKLVAAALEYRVSDRIALQAGLASLVSGYLALPRSRHEFAGGLSLSLSGSYRLLEEKGLWPFLGLTATLGFATAKTFEPRSATVAYNAFDLRVGALVGKTVADVLTLYAAGRVFGGPIFWRNEGARVTGTDIYKYQVGGGASLALWRRIDVFVEGIALGEQMLSAGLGVSY